MQIRQLATGAALAASLAAQEGAPGFQWVGVRGGSMSFDPQERMKTSPLLGGQGGLVFDQQRYGLSLEVLSSRPESTLVPTRQVSHSLVSLTLLSGLSGTTSSPFWPYFGLGAGTATVAKTSPSTPVITSGQSAEAHAAFGFLHRPFRGFIWGAEGRYLVTFSNPGLSAYQGSVLLGLTWGGSRTARRVEPPLPSPEAAPPPPPRPLPVVEVAPPPPASPPPTPPPILVVEAPPPQVPAARPVPVAPSPVRLKPEAVPAPAAALPPPGPGQATLTERLEALRREDMARATDLGRKRILAIPAHHWTVRLEVANLSSTLKRAVEAFPAGDADLFIAPLQLPGGKTAYQLFLGAYPSKAAAERAARTVPPFFLEGGNRPKPIAIAQIPLRANR